MTKRLSAATLLFLSLMINWIDIFGQIPEKFDSLAGVCYKKFKEGKFLEEDAVMLLQYRTIYSHLLIYNSWSSNSNPYGFNPNNSSHSMGASHQLSAAGGSVEHVYQRILINTRQGADEYSRIYIPKNTQGNIVKISAKTIKPDGREIVVKQEDIKEMQNVTDGTFDWKMAHYRFSVPGVEAGDQIEIEYFINKPSFSTNGDYFFSCYLPVIQSTVRLSFSNSLVVSVKNYNGLKSPITGSEAGNYWMEYSRYNLSALRDYDHAIFYNEMPYCRYQIVSYRSPFEISPDGIKISVNNWTEFSAGFIQSQFDNELKNSKAKYLDKFVASHYHEGKESPRIALKRMLDCIADSMKVYYSEAKPEYCSGYYLSRRSIPYTAIYRIYSDLFEKLGMEYFYILGALKARGKLDTAMVSSSDYSILFFAFKDEKDSLRYVFPENSLMKTCPEEISPYYFGSCIMLMYPKEKGRHAFGKLPDFPCAYNMKTRKNRIDVDLSFNSMNFNAVTIKSGAFSFLDRVFDYRSPKDSLQSQINRYLNNDIKNFVVDTSYFTGPDSVFPFKYYFHYNGHQKDRIVRLADSLYSIDLSDWLDHSVIQPTSTDRFVDFYPDFRYSELFNYYYVFKAPVKVQNPSSLSCSITNNFGSYLFSVTQISDTVVQVQSTYKIVKAMLPATEYSQLKQLYEQWSLFRNSSFIVRLKQEQTGKTSRN